MKEDKESNVAFIPQKCSRFAVVLWKKIIMNHDSVFTIGIAYVEIFFFCKTLI